MLPMPNPHPRPTAGTLLCALCILLAGACATERSTHSASGRTHGGWKLVWADEFDKSGMPDRSKWNYEEGFIRNEEAQYYTRARRENARVEHGTLVIEARKERWRNPDYRRGAKDWQQSREFARYTAASLTTRNIATWKYGRIEVRAKLPEGLGTWPAIWTLGASGHWPAKGEIDIMEWWGKNPQYVCGTTHYALGGRHQYNQGKIKVQKPSRGFHVYALEWTPDRLDFYFDKTRYFSFPIDKANQGKFNPYRQPHYLILNLALEGWPSSKIDDSKLPQHFVVDYVRVYQRR